MKLCVANTDYDWYKYLSSQKDLDEVNFWFPKKKTQVRLSAGELFIFKLKKEHEHKIVGFGNFSTFKLLSMKEMWETYGYKNGGDTQEGLVKRLKNYNDGVLENIHLNTFGCSIVSSPVFFPTELWIDAPNDWKDNFMTYRMYKSDEEEGKRILEQCCENAKKVNPNT